MYTSLKASPGINVEQTPLLNSAGWSYSQAIRWRDGLPEKIGGWTALNMTPLVGICTGMHAWADLDSVPYIACGTDQRLQLFDGGVIVDITPIRRTVNITPAFSTGINSDIINIKDVTNGAAIGDWVDIPIPVSVGGLIVQGFYRVVSIVDADNYTVIASSDATGNVTDGGAVPVFDTTMSSPNVQVTLDNHGQIVGDSFGVQASTTVGGLTIAVGVYPVVAPVTTNTFVIQPGGSASSSATVAENSAHVRLEYLIPSGPSDAEYASGYGAGDYGAGDYGGSANGGPLIPLRQWFLDNFGEDLIANYTGSPLYLWVPPVGTDNVAIVIDTNNYPDAQDPPKQVVFSFVAAPQQMVIAGGCNTPGTSDFDPNLLRWSDQSDFTDWTALATNQAGSYRIPSGSRLVGGISAPNFTVIWTDVDMWLMNYLGGSGLAELVWGFNKVAGSNGLLSARACAVYRNIVFYASSNGVYLFNGNQVTLVPCPVWDKFWKNLNRLQVDKVNMEVNSYFQELSIAFPSAGGDGTVDSRITYNIRENIWAYDDPPTLTARTAWVDENVYGSPAGTDLSGYIQQQDSEGVYDANGVALPASVRTGWFSIQEGSLLGMLERLEADLIVTGGNQTIQVTVFAQDYATGPVRTYGPYTWVVGQGPPWSIVRARGRFMSIQIASVDVGVFWRLGDLRFRVQPAGRRP